MSIVVYHCTFLVVFMDEAGLPEESHESLKVSCIQYMYVGT